MDMPDRDSIPVGDMPPPRPMHARPHPYPVTNVDVERIANARVNDATKGLRDAIAGLRGDVEVLARQCAALEQRLNAIAEDR